MKCFTGVNYCEGGWNGSITTTCSAQGRNGFLRDTVRIYRENITWNKVEWKCNILGRRGSRIQKGGFVQEFRLENRSYPDVHDFSLRMQVITCIASD